MSRFTRWILTIAVLTLPILALWAYRTSVVASASEYQPRATPVPLLPEGTEIVVLINGIPEGTAQGDSISGITTTPVSVQDQVILPPGTLLTATVERIAVEKKRAKVRLRFESLVLDGSPFNLHADPVVTIIPIRDDFSILGQVFMATAKSAIAASIGAASENPDLVAKSVGLEAQQSVPQPDSDSAQIHVRLSRPLWLQ